MQRLLAQADEQLENTMPHMLGGGGMTVQLCAWHYAVIAMRIYTWGLIYKISYDYLKFIVRSTYDSD